MTNSRLPLIPWRWLLLLGLTVCLGCSSKPALDHRPTFPVRGQVLFEGKGVHGALVVFHPVQVNGTKLVRSYARTETDGSFVMSTYKPLDGVPAGKYAVTVSLPDDNAGVHLLPERYASTLSSGLLAQVSEGDNRLPPFRLRRS